VVSPLPDVIGLGGTIDGLIGGLAMAVVAAIISVMQGGDIWLESKQIATIVYGPAALAQEGFNFGPVLVGTLLHFAVSAALGAIFGIVTRRLLRLTSDFGTYVLAGLIYGMLVWLLAFFVVLPLFNPALLESYAPSFIVQHLVYGAVTGLVYTVLRPEPYS
jgi:uncharacterized YccA/Bax inhibitor family protein